MKTTIEDHAKRIVKLLEEFDSLAYSPDDQAKAAMLIGARMLTIEKELIRIGEHIDPTWRAEGGVHWNLKALPK